MRLVVDTNGFVSAALKNASFPASSVRWIDRHGGLLKSQATERQLLDVLQRPYIAARMPPWFLENVRRLLAAAELVAITECIAACRDPTDDKFLELAANGNADLIVSGDADLLVLRARARRTGIAGSLPWAFSRRLDKLLVSFVCRWFDKTSTKVCHRLSNALELGQLPSLVVAKGMTCSFLR